MDQAKVDFTERGNLKPENPEKNPRSTGETNYNNSTHMCSKYFKNQHEDPSSYNPVPTLLFTINTMGRLQKQ